MNIKQESESDGNFKILKDEIETLRENLIKFNETSNNPHEYLELKKEFKSLKSLINRGNLINEVTKVQNEMINEILSTPEFLQQNFNIDCLSKNSIELLYYYRFGLFLDIIKEKIASKTAEIHHNSLVTGLIKGTGIANLYINEDGTYKCKQARNFYVKSMRVYRAYSVHKEFSRVLAQIVCARKVSTDKLLKIKNDETFERFVKELIPVVVGNFKHNFDSLKLFEKSVKIENLISTEIENKIIDEVLRFIKNPSQPIKKENNSNPLLKKLLDRELQ